MNSLRTEAEMFFIDHGTISLVVSVKSKSSHTNPAPRQGGRVADAQTEAVIANKLAHWACVQY
jgi:hypothetical protein